MRLLVLIFGLALACVSPVTADEIWAGYGPDVPKATGEPHPEGNAYWRQHHMQMMMHDRNLTVHDGDREINASLSQCFECHAVKDDAGGYVTYESEKHFCRACHDYAAVKVDCFMCHRSTPEGFEEPPLHAMGTPTAQDVRLAQTYLEQTIGGTAPESERAQ